MSCNVFSRALLSVWLRGGVFGGWIFWRVFSMKLLQNRYLMVAWRHASKGYNIPEMSKIIEPHYVEKMCIACTLIAF